jgi:hypothetical protein
MQILTSLNFDASLTLSALQDLVSDNEINVGPLVDINSDRTDTVLTFDKGADSPAKTATLRLVVDGVTPTVAGAGLVCQGNCLIEGAITGVAAFREGAANVVVPAPVGGVAALAWGARVSADFGTKVRAIATNLGIDPNFLMACMAFETGQTFSPSKRNPVSSATGLIQFLSSTAMRLGTTVTALAGMTAEAQLTFVEKYFLPKKGQLHSLTDVYMQILRPVAVGKPDDFVLFSRATDAGTYNANRGLDLNDDGTVTKNEATSKVAAMLTLGLRPGNVG